MILGTKDDFSSMTTGGLMVLDNGISSKPFNNAPLKSITGRRPILMLVVLSVDEKIVPDGVYVLDSIFAEFR